MKRTFNLIDGAVAALAASAVAAITMAISYGVSASTTASATDEVAPPSSATSVSDSSKEPKLKYGSGVLLATDDFPRNSRGQSYGSDADAESREEAPQLIGVMGDSGTSGFVLREDLWPTQPSSPAEAARMNQAKPLVLQMFDQEGKALNDTFTVGVGISSGEMGRDEE